MATGLFGTGTAPAQLPTTPLRPAATPGSTFVQPVRRQAGGNLEALANALSGLNGALVDFAKTKDAIRDDPNSRANQEWIAKREQMTLDELLADPDQGTGVRVREDARSALLGERANLDFRQEWLTYYNTDFDRTRGDAKAEFEAMRQKYAGALPDEIARGNFYRNTNGYLDSVLTADTEEKVTTAKGQIGATIVDAWSLKINDMLAAGNADPEKIAAEVFAAGEANSKFFSLSGQEQIAHVVALAEKLATEGQPELVKALLTTPRGDAPAISSLPEYASKTLKLTEAAQSVRDAADDKNSLDLRLDVNGKVLRGEFTAEDAAALDGTPFFNDSQLAGLVAQSDANRARVEAKALSEDQKREFRRVSEDARQGALASALTLMGVIGGQFKLKDVEIPNPSGNGTTTYTIEEQKADAREYWEEQWGRSEAKAIADGADPVEARKQTDAIRLAWYANNAVKNETWQNRFTSLPMMATPETFRNRPEVIAQFVETAELYRNLRAQNPAYAETLVDQKSREFLDLYDSAVADMGMRPADALAMASGLSARTDIEKTGSRLSPKAADDIVTGILRDLDVDGAEGQSYTILSSKVQTYAAMGLSPAAIRKNTEKWAQESTVVVNDMLMASENPLPPDFANVADRYLDRIFRTTPQDSMVTYGEALGIESADDLYLQPIAGESKWQVYSKSTGLPIGNLYLDEKGIRDERQRAEEERDRALRERAAADDKARKDEAKAQRAWEKSWFPEYYEEERARIESIRRPAKGAKKGRTTQNDAAADAALEDLNATAKALGMEWLLEENKPKVADGLGTGPSLGSPPTGGTLIITDPHDSERQSKD